MSAAATVLIDTSALLALANPRDQYHEVAVASARRFVDSGGRFVASVMVLSEVHVHVLYRAGAERARDLISALLADPLYEWYDVPVDLVESAVSAWLERFAGQKFSLTDAVSFELMRREKISQAFAFDEHFRIAGWELYRSAS
ncbi:MAG: type II toxin-antitoxin system VapC family toxin [Gemmatimonadales bacterium]